jgi:hypothetical protein
MWGYIIIAFIFVYALYKERQALGCPTIPDGTDCDNCNGKAIKGTKPTHSDSVHTIKNKIKKAADFSDRWVVWRIAVMLGIVCPLIFFFFLYQRLPTEYEWTLSAFVITVAIYFTLNFYKFHLIDHAKNNISEGVDMLAGGH